MKKRKLRLDQLLLEKGYFSSRNKAQSIIIQGRVFVEDKKIVKCGAFVAEDADIRIDYRENEFVGRGGEKLNGALDIFSVSPKDKIAADIGASTGGFSDCLLQRGCALVYAIDVGYGQLDMQLRKNDRVIPIERTNARYLDWDSFNKLVTKAIKNEIKQNKKIPITEPRHPNLIVMDVSFISILKILPALKSIIERDGEIVSLVKPQFEATREQVGKGGIITDPKVHREVMNKIIHGAKKTGFEFVNKCESPIKGTEGNKEFFVHLKNKESS